MPDKLLPGICGYELFAKLMQTRILSKRVLLIVALLGFILFVVFFLNFIPKNSTQGSSELFVENVAVLSSQEQVSVGLPVRLKIPSINVNSSIEYVGLTSDGAMDVPEDRNEVAWFDIGPRPGEEGNAVIAGHYGWENNIPAVFNDLHKLVIGDQILVEDDKGVIITFVVRKIRTYDKDEVILDVFDSNNGKGSRLNLITCTGDWNEAEETRSDRLIIYTDKV